MIKQIHYYFWLLMLAALTLLGLGLIISGHYIQNWIQTLWQVCQGGLQQLLGTQTFSWQLIIPLLILIIIMRGSWSLGQQLWATRQLTRLFYPLRQPLPTQVKPLLQTLGLKRDDVVFLNLNTIQVFCLGFWQPRIWLTAGLVNLLSEEELTAVLAHEAHHQRQYDPLRLLISRSLKAAFFFLPLLHDLAKNTELQQEIAADHSAIHHLNNNDLPLLSALHKLLRQDQQTSMSMLATYSPFNPTEARLKRLVYSSPTTNNHRNLLVNGFISLGIVLLLSSTVFFSNTQTIAPTYYTPSNTDDIEACHIEPNTTNENLRPKILCCTSLNTETVQ